MYLRQLTSVFVLLSASLAAHADTISTFNLNGSSIFFGMGGDQNTVTGSTTIDITTGIVESISFTAGGSFQSGVDAQQGPTVFVGASNAKISFDAGSLINYQGGAFDLNGPNDLYVGHGMVAAVIDPSVTSAATAPEPSSIALLGTGLLGVLGAVRRRIRRV